MKTRPERGGNGMEAGLNRKFKDPRRVRVNRRKDREISIVLE